MSTNENKAFEAGEVETLQNIIHSGKAERKRGAEEKRRKNLDRIREMKSATGFHPLERFPKEIWSKLFDEVDAESRASASMVHPTFHDLLKSSRIETILLPMLLKVDIFKNIQKVRLTSDANVPFDLTLTEFSNLRSVSKTTRKSVDQFMEAYLITRIQEDDIGHANPFNDRCLKRDYTMNFHFESDRQQLSATLANFKDPENPAKYFFSRGITVLFHEHATLRCDEVLTMCNTFVNDMTSLLEIIGDQIWNFRLLIFEPTKPRLNYFSELGIHDLTKKWLLLIPNVKWLELQLSFCSCHHEAIYGDYIYGIEIRHIRFRSLERISLHFHSLAGIALEVYKAVLSKNQHIKCIDLLDIDTKLEFRPIVCQIQSLNLNMITFSFFNDRQNLRTVMEVINVNWKLQTISLKLRMHQDIFDSILRLLENFSTLENIKLDLYTPNLKDTSSRYLELPKLKTFKLVMREPAIHYENGIDFFFSLQFLLYCRHLTKLSWNVQEIDDARLRRYLKDRENKGTLNFRAGLRCVYESNIWEVFPRLELVDVNIRRTLFQLCPCSHIYRRPGAKECVGVGEFVRSHKCCESNSFLANCVVLCE